jgi:RNA polymerase sigma factor (sigma-70 family)
MDQADYYKKEKTYIRFMQFELTDDRHTDTNAQDKLEFDDLVRLLDFLPDRSAEVFRLFAIEGYSHEEIGEKMSISAGTSKWHLSHARERLRMMLTNERHARATTI